MDATGFGYPLGQIPRMDTLSFAADERLIKLAGEACKNAVPEIGVHVGRVVSGFLVQILRQLLTHLGGDIGGQLLHRQVLFRVGFQLLFFHIHGLPDRKSTRLNSSHSH